MLILEWIGIFIFLTLIVIGAALREGIRKMDTATLQAQVSAGTPIDISQVRAMEQQLLDALDAGRVREVNLQTTFETFTQNLSSQLDDVTKKYNDLFLQTNAVNTQDFSSDMARLQEAVDKANAIGIGTLADFTPPPSQAASPITVAGGTTNATGGVTYATGGASQTAAPISADDAAAAAQTAQDQATAAASGTAVPVAVPPGASVDTHETTGVVTITLPAGTPVVQAAPASDADQEAAPQEQQPTPEEANQQDAPGDQQQSA